jgi:Integrase core domain
MGVRHACLPSHEDGARGRVGQDRGGAREWAWGAGGCLGVPAQARSIYLEDFDTHEHAQTAVFAYIEVFSNRQRCHSANGYLAPLAYEQALKANGTFCPEKC